jgi:hypothetical protein
LRHLPRPEVDRHREAAVLIIRGHPTFKTATFFWTVSVTTAIWHRCESGSGTQYKEVAARVPDPWHFGVDSYPDPLIHASY